MKKLIKRTLSCVLSAAVVISGLPAFTLFETEIVSAAENARIYPDTKVVDSDVIKDDNLRIALKTIIGGSKTASITVGDLKAYEGAIDLSAYTNINNVEGLGFALKAQSFDLSKLSKVTGIEDYEFKDCAATSISLPGNITSIGRQAFANCYDLENISIPSAVTSIGEQAFLSCESLENITLPNGLSYLGTQAFAQCISLQSIVIPDNINAMIESADETEMVGIGESVFYGCTSLYDVTLGAGMTSIPAGMFQGDTSLLTITIPDKISSIRNSAFSATGLLFIDLSNTEITRIYENTFSNCLNLSYVKMPSELRVIGNYAFSNCQSLTDIEMSSHLTTIGDYAFTRCSGLTDGSFMKDCNELVEIGRTAFYKTGIVNLILPSNLKTIKPYAFSELPNLKTVTVKDFTDIPKDGTVMKDFKEYCFSSCKQLTTFSLPTTNQNKLNVSISLGERMFSECYKLENINFPANIVKIDSYAFYKCGLYTTDYNDESIYAVDHIDTKKLGTVYYVDADEVSLKKDASHPDKVFGYSLELGANYYQARDLYVSSNNLRTTYSDGLKKIILEGGTGQTRIYQEVEHGLKTVDLTACNRIETLGTNVFDSCVCLKSAYLPDTMTKIPDEMFRGCGSGRFMGNGNKMSSLGRTTLYDNTVYGLNYVKMDNVEVIGASAFSLCYNLSIENSLPKNIRVISSGAFNNVYGIKSFVIPETLEYIGNSAFANTAKVYDNEIIKYGLTSLDGRVAKKLKYVGANAFQGSAIDKIQFYSDAPLEYIGSSAFYNCQHLLTAQMPKQLRYIGDKAFGMCIRLRNLNIFDRCTVNSQMISGESVIKNLANSSEGFYCSYKDSSNPANNIYVTYQFVFKIDPIETELDYRLNESALLPLEVIKNDDSRSTYSEIKIGDYKYEYDPEAEGRYFGGEGAPVTPSFAQKSVSFNKGYETTSKIYNTISFFGKEKAENVSVKASISFKFPTGSNSSYNCETSVDYKINVVEVKCDDIVAENTYYIPVSTSATNGNKITVTPKFYPMDENGKTLITAIPEWKVESGEDLITLTPSSDGKSAEIRGKNQYGTAKIKVSAGGKSKSFYVYITDIANGISAYIDDKKVDSGSNVDLIVGDETSLTVKTSYSQNEPHPEGISITSSDESIVSISDIQTDNLVTTAKLKGIKTGKATLTIKRLASNSNYTVNVVVSAAGLKLTLTDSDDNNITNNKEIKLTNNVSCVLKYNINRELSDMSVVAQMTDNDKNVIGYNIDSNTKTITFTGKKLGTATVTIYPKAANSSYGITLKVKVLADVSNVSLAYPTLEVGKKANIVTSVKNTFGQFVDVTKGEDYKTITDNKFVFESSDPDSVSVDSKGVVKAIKKPFYGKGVKITCTVYRNDVVIGAYNSTVNVRTPELTGITVKGPTVLYVGQKKEYTYNKMPSNCNTHISAEAVSPSGIVSFEQVGEKVLLTGLKEGRVILSINATDDNGITHYNSITITVKKDIIPKVSLKKPVSKKKKVQLKWEKTSRAEGYIVQMSTKKNKGFKTIKKIKSGSITKFVKKKLKSKKTYYFRVKAYGKSIKGKTIQGKWSKVKKVKVK